ncbi:MAG: hypothetical protein HYZ90_04505 [Candidatus Omnitrophica bacterium]|nr:hypothetical protein [Candidatus Omnitrophota bacterium]
MKMKWWGWIGIGLIVYAANAAKENRIVSIGESVTEAGGLAGIGLALGQFPFVLAYIIAGVLIWLSARDKSN